MSISCQTEEGDWIDCPLFFGEELSSWLEQIELFLIQFQIQTEQYVHFASHHMMGDAYSWVFLHEDSIAYWSLSQFKNALQDEFDPKPVDDDTNHGIVAVDDWIEESNFSFDGIGMTAPLENPVGIGNNVEEVWASISSEHLPVNSAIGSSLYISKINKNEEEGSDVSSGNVVSYDIDQDVHFMEDFIATVEVPIAWETKPDSSFQSSLVEKKGVAQLFDEMPQRSICKYYNVLGRDLKFETRCFDPGIQLCLQIGRSPCNVHHGFDMVTDQRPLEAVQFDSMVNIHGWPPPVKIFCSKYDLPVQMMFFVSSLFNSRTVTVMKHGGMFILCELDSSGPSSGDSLIVMVEIHFPCSDVAGVVIEFYSARVFDTIKVLICGDISMKVSQSMCDSKEDTVHICFHRSIGTYFRVFQPWRIISSSHPNCTTIPIVHSLDKATYWKKVFVVLAWKLFHQHLHIAEVSEVKAQSNDAFFLLRADHGGFITHFPELQYGSQVSKHIHLLVAAENFMVPFAWVFYVVTRPMLFMDAKYYRVSDTGNPDAVLAGSMVKLHEWSVRRWSELLETTLNSATIMDTSGDYLVWKYNYIVASTENSARQGMVSEVTTYISKESINLKSLNSYSAPQYTSLVVSYQRSSSCCSTHIQFMISTLTFQVLKSEVPGHFSFRHCQFHHLCVLLSDMWQAYRLWLHPYTGWYEKLYAPSNSFDCSLQLVTLHSISGEGYGNLITQKIMFAESDFWVVADGSWDNSSIRCNKGIKLLLELLFSSLNFLCVAASLMCELYIKVECLQWGEIHSDNGLDSGKFIKKNLYFPLQENDSLVDIDVVHGDLVDMCCSPGLRTSVLVICDFKGEYMLVTSYGMSEDQQPYTLQVVVTGQRRKPVSQHHAIQNFQVMTGLNYSRRMMSLTAININSIAKTKRYQLHLLTTHKYTIDDTTLFGASLVAAVVTKKICKAHSSPQRQLLKEVYVILDNSTLPREYGSAGNEVLSVSVQRAGMSIVHFYKSAFKFGGDFSILRVFLVVETSILPHQGIQTSGQLQFLDSFEWRLCVDLRCWMEYEISKMKTASATLGRLCCGCSLQGSLLIT